jgi:hypothetical protein
MPDQLVTTVPPPFEDAAAMRRANAGLLEAIDQQLGGDSSPERETAALRDLESKIRDFLDRGAETGTLVEDIKERTACQVLLDYWSSTLSHAGIRVARSRLAPFDAERLPDLGDEKCPYVGLEPFHNSAFFFGRERAVKSLLQRVSEVPLVVVQGGSGSGKSSLVMGGALPVLGAAEHVPQFRLVGPFTPGNVVLENLVRAVFASNPDARFDRVAEAETLRANPARLPEMLGIETATTPALLVVDQFEELFTLCNDGDRAAIAAAIGALLQSCPACRVVLTLREEFANELDKLEPLGPYLAQHARFSMKEWPMGYDELRGAVERPAALVNLHFAPGIVDDLVKSVLGQDTALPLLQFALQSLWKRRDRNRVTREVYEKVGNPLVALERYAEGFYNGLLPENQQEVERILLELVRIDRMMEAYREPQMRSTLLATGNPRTPEMLKLLAREDFLRIIPTVDGDATVEVKHEALLRNWPRYVKWIGGKREGVRQRLALTEAAQRWDARGRTPHHRPAEPMAVARRAAPDRPGPARAGLRASQQRPRRCRPTRTRSGQAAQIFFCGIRGRSAGRAVRQPVVGDERANSSRPLASAGGARARHRGVISRPARRRTHRSVAGRNQDGGSAGKGSSRLAPAVARGPAVDAPERHQPEAAVHQG